MNSAESRIALKVGYIESLVHGKSDYEKRIQHTKHKVELFECSTLHILS